VLGVPVRRPANPETTVLGAASLAGIAEGVWDSPAEAAAAWREEAAFTPQPLPDADRRRAQWRKAVDRSQAWADAEP
jgi:glycerol kinase